MQLSGRGPRCCYRGGRVCVGLACLASESRLLRVGWGWDVGQGWEWEFPMNVINVIMGINWLKDSRNAH